MRNWIRIAFAILVAAFPLAVEGEGPPTDPIMRIETGMHTAPIVKIATDSAGRFLVTGSADKTVRVWDPATGNLLRTLRPPLGAETEGIVFAVAMSPDGRLVAASGMTGYQWAHKFSIYLFDRESGKLVQRLGELPSAAYHLSFSPDGRKLAAVLLDSKGVQLFRTADGHRVAWDSSYRNAAIGLDWDPSGRLVTSSWDGYIRLYTGDLQLVEKVKSPSGKEPCAVRFSSDGEKIAVGFHDTTNLDVLASNGLRSLYRPDTGGTPNLNFEVVAWSSDGESLYAAGMNPATGISLVRRWTDAGRGGFRDLPTGSFNTVAGLSGLPGGRLAFGTSDPAWGVLASDGSEALFVKSGILDFRDPGGLGVDATGGRIRFGYRYAGEKGAKDLAVFSVPDRNLVMSAPAEQGLAGPRTEAPGLSISDWKGPFFKPTLAGRPLPLYSAEQSCSLAIAADGRSFLLGTSVRVRSFDARGKERWKTAPQVAAWAVNVSGDGRLAVVAFADGTIRWYRADNGKELLAFFPHADRKRWVAWTPSGYYDASVGGEDLIGWHINRGPDAAADFFPVSRFRSRFYRPDVVARVLETLDEATALAQADTEAHRKAEPTVLTKVLPPVVTILAPAAETEVREAGVTFRVTVRSPSGEPVTAVRAFIDGRPAGSTRGLAFVPDPQPAAEPSADRVYSLTVPVPAHDCTVAIAAETGLATSEPVAVKLHWAAASPPPAKPVLYLLAVGVGTFANPAINKLDLPAKDARDVAASWKAQKGGLYRDVEVKLLTDAEATKDAILDGLEWLERQTTERDVAILYFSGHGVNDPRSGEYLFLPYEADLESRRKTMLPDREVRSALSTIPGKVIVFLDTCHSGNLLGTAKVRDATDLTRLLNELTSAENGVAVFSASTGRQQAIESKEWKNGAFTLAMLEALGGKAEKASYRENSLYLTELESYLDRRVKELTRGLQTPVTAKPGGMPNFPLAVIMVPK